MTKEELTNWEHRPDVIRVLTSYEMGAWLHRRDKRLLQEIRADIEQTAEEEQKHDEKWALGLRYAVKIIDKYNAESEDDEE